MVVLLDIGNSRIKWGWLDENGLQTGQPLPTAGAFETCLETAWSGLTPSRAVVSNVAGADLEKRLDGWLMARFGIAAEFVSSRARGYGVISGYQQPERLGCDRWVALVALRHGWQGAACVLDVGTAATFDLLDGSGRHRGGAIAPGLELMARTLATHTVRIGDAPAAAGGWLGNTTAAAIHSGTLNALAGMAERLRRRASLELGQPLAGIVTGGGAAAVLACLDDDWVEAPDLLLQGLAVIARETP